MNTVNVNVTSQGGKGAPGYGDSIKLIVKISSQLFCVESSAHT